MFIAALFTVAGCGCPSTNGCMNKMWYMYTVEYYSAINKNEMMSFAGNGWS
jgi:hypothetical protein